MGGRFAIKLGLGSEIFTYIAAAIKIIKMWSSSLVYLCGSLVIFLTVLVLAWTIVWKFLLSGIPVVREILDLDATERPKDIQYNGSRRNRKGKQQVDKKL